MILASFQACGKFLKLPDVSHGMGFNRDFHIVASFFVARLKPCFMGFKRYWQVFSTNLYIEEKKE